MQFTKLNISNGKIRVQRSPKNRIWTANRLEIHGWPNNYFCILWMEPGDGFKSFLTMPGSQSYTGLAASVLTCKLELHLLLGLGGLVFAAYTQPQQQSGKRNVIPRHAHDMDHFERANQYGQSWKLFRKYKMKPRAGALPGPNTSPWCSLPHIPFLSFWGLLPFHTMFLLLLSLLI